MYPKYKTSRSHMTDMKVDMDFKLKTLKVNTHMDRRF
jgi:hypothetical protein